jgi:hypothetical protein
MIREILSLIEEVVRRWEVRWERFTTREIRFCAHSPSSPAVEIPKGMTTIPFLFS